MKKAIASFIVGVLFALGLGVAGMTQPQKVIGFLDVSAWDPSLIFVMIGAIGVHAALYPLIRKRPAPVLDVEFHVPQKKEITISLIGGAVIFGIGWGLAGFCPGPAVVSLATGDKAVAVFAVMVVAGMFAYRLYERWSAR